MPSKVVNPLTGKLVNVTDSPSSVFQRLMKNTFVDSAGRVVDTRNKLMKMYGSALLSTDKKTGKTSTTAKSKKTKKSKQTTKRTTKRGTSKRRTTKTGKNRVTMSKSATGKGRGGATAGWKNVAKKLSRPKLAATHPGCFLMPDRKKYPICTQNGQMVCAGIKSARRRAYINAFSSKHANLDQAAHRKVFEKASALDVQKCAGPIRYGSH